MLYSMTGYGRHELEENNRKISVEISTVNHRYCDINIRMPRTLIALEENVRKLIKTHITRGKVEVNIYCYSLSEDDVEVVVNENVCSAYLEALRNIGIKYQLEDNLTLSDIVKMSDIMTVQKKANDMEAVWNGIEKASLEALKELMAMREKEGEALKNDLLQKADTVLTLVEEVEKLSPLVVAEYKKKLEDRLAVLLGDVPVDEHKVAMEVAIFADKCAIDEEITRLRSHVVQLKHILEEENAVGRKLDFLMQELNREANTIASKSNDASITKYAVTLKTEIEKMREQIQNIE